MPLVPIIMGSKTDLSHGTKVKDALARYGITAEIRVASAHKAPAFLLEILHGYERNEDVVAYVAIAGRSNALSGVVDGAVTRPVISAPPYSDRFGGADIFSSLRMPSGIVPALVLDPEGAAMFVAKIASLREEGIRETVREAQGEYQKKLMRDDDETRRG